MTRVVPAALLCAVLCACSDGSSKPLILNARKTATTDSTPNEPDPAYGWSRPVTAAVFSAAATKLGGAESVLDGHTLQAIVTDATVRVRGDNQACSTCHDWAKTISRAAFCERVPAFLALPTAKGDGTDDPSAKPLVLKELLELWHAAGCPE
jgi:hypothetical protein